MNIKFVGIDQYADGTIWVWVNRYVPDGEDIKSNLHSYLATNKQPIKSKLLLKRGIQLINMVVNSGNNHAN